MSGDPIKVRKFWVINPRTRIKKVKEYIRAGI
jgi:hypothetical protein